MPDVPNADQRVLALLQQYGWETGYKKLEAALRGGAGSDNGGSSEREVSQFFLGWMAAERGDYDGAIRQFHSARALPLMAGWALLGEAFVAMRQKDFARTHILLGEARQRAADDVQLRATIAHVEGATRYHQGQSREAEPLLRSALDLYGPDHFSAGRVMDTLGMIQAGRDNFHGARELFERALERKKSDDFAGLAVTHGQLGRLHLDWGRLDDAQKHFEEDLEIADRIGDEHGKALMYNSLGRVALARSEREPAAGRPALARRHWDEAAGWLEKAISRTSEKGWTISEAYARKDRALLAIAEGEHNEAQSQLDLAEKLVRDEEFEEGLAHINRARGMLWAKLRRWDDATVALRAARTHFEDAGEGVEVARTLFESARVHAAADEPKPLVVRALHEALTAAEACRRAELVRRIEEELMAVDPAAYYARAYRRVRGRAVAEDAASLIDGVRETATVLFLDLQGSSELARFRDPGEMMMTLNQMMAQLAASLRTHNAQVVAFRGDGFMALLRGAGDAARGVAAALDLIEAMKTFNEPRAVLSLPPFIARIGVNTGEVYLGNVGTYDKMDFTAIGNTVNLGARLEGQAERGMPCIGRGTYENVQKMFRFSEQSPRTVELKGLGPTQMWDVVGRVS
jgi:class 3 adenylate cyclase/uncharacterized protein HemY